MSCTLHSTNGSISEKKKIIFDTDMGPDYDDVGAIAILHALADSAECEILATLSCNGHPNVAPTIETFNRYFNRSDIPIGIPENPIVNTIPSNHWNDSVIAKFQPDLKSEIPFLRESEWPKWIRPIIRWHGPTNIIWQHMPKRLPKTECRGI